MRSRSRVKSGLAVVLALTFVSSSSAQSTPHIVADGAPECGGCEIERCRVAVIHDRSYPEGALGEMASPHALRDGRFLVRSGPMYNELFPAAPSGEILARIGGVGDGPGEFRMPEFVAESRDAVLVIDPWLNRLTRLTRTDLDLMATVPLRGFNGGTPPIAFEDGTILMSEDLVTRESYGLPLHLVNPRGEVVRSFGPEGVENRPRVLALSGDTAFWAAIPDRYHDGYRIEHWSREGTLLGVLLRKASWFSERTDELEAGDRYHLISGLHQDPAGRLWVHIMELTRSPGGGTIADPDASATIVEVLSPQEGIILVSLRLPGLREYSMAQRFYQFVPAEDDLGRREVHIWTYHLLTPQFDGGEGEP